MVSLPSCFTLTSPALNLLPFLYLLSHPFTCLNLGEKQGKREERGGPGTSFQLGRQLPALCAVGSAKASWGISKELQLLTHIENSIYPSKVRSPPWSLSVISLYLDAADFTPFPKINP